MTPRLCYGCPYYVKGEPGSRRCKRNLWNECRPELLPLLGQDLQVIRPKNCWIRFNPDGDRA